MKFLARTLRLLPILFGLLAIPVEAQTAPKTRGKAKTKAKAKGPAAPPEPSFLAPLAESHEITADQTTDAGNTFADSATDPSGRVWVVGQEVRPGRSRVHARVWSPDTTAWSEPILLSDAAGGHWEPPP